jgi:IS5 family transposase
MRRKERHSTGQADIFRSRLDQIIEMEHRLVLLGAKIDWDFLEPPFCAVWSIQTASASRRCVPSGVTLRRRPSCVAYG